MFTHLIFSCAMENKKRSILFYYEILYEIWAKISFAIMLPHGKHIQTIL